MICLCGGSVGSSTGSWQIGVRTVPSCSLNITGVVGVYTVKMTPTICATAIKISGTVVSSLASPPCPVITVSATCQYGSTSTSLTYSGTIDRNGIVTGQVTGGFLVGDNWQVTLNTNCCCGTQVIVAASCPSLNCSASETVLSLRCQSPCCPMIETQVSYGECDGSGNALVTFTVSVNAAAIGACKETAVQMDFGGGSPLGAIHTFPPSGSFTEQHQYSSGPHIAFINVISPAGCQQVEVPINVPCPPAGCCPKIAPDVSYGPCDAAGISLVTFVVSVSPNIATGCPETEVQMDFGDGNPLGATQTFLAPGSFTEQHSYSSGPHTAFVNVISPTGCKQVQIPISVQCTPCCPDVSITPCIPDCDGDANRTVTFEISVTKKPLPCPPIAVSFQMDFGDGSSGAPITAPANLQSYSYTEVHPYTGSAALQSNTASLQISQPPQCAGSYSPQVIPACCTKARAAWCENLFWTMSFSLAFALLFGLFTLFPATFSCATCLLFTTQPGYVPLYSFYLFAILGVVALIVYILFCKKCRCIWFYFLLWRTLFGAGLLYFVFAKCSLGILSVLIGLGLMLIGYLFLKKWMQDCCVALCDVLKESLVWLVLIMFIASIFAAIVLGLSLANGCIYNLSPNPGIPLTTYWIALTATALYTIYVTKKC